MRSLWPQGSAPKGFTVLEVILAIGFTGMVVVMFFSIIRFTEVNAAEIYKRDDGLMQGRFAISYIMEDVLLSDEIWSVDDYCPNNIKGEDTLGFILINDTRNRDTGYNYQYIYYKTEYGQLSRNTYNSNQKLIEGAPSNGGKNILHRNIVSSENSYYCSQDMLLHIEITTKTPQGEREYVFMETRNMEYFSGGDI